MQESNTMTNVLCVVVINHDTIIVVQHAHTDTEGATMRRIIAHSLVQA
jgi:hypothetical protein